MTVEEAQKGFKRAQERYVKYNSMTLLELEAKIVEQEEWMKKNPKHRMFKELESAHGHAKMIYGDRLREKEIEEALK